MTAFDIARTMALGADWCNSARGYMFSLGCIQSLSATPTAARPASRPRIRALAGPPRAGQGRARGEFPCATLHCLSELTAAAGLDHPGQFDLDQFRRRVSETSVISFADLFPAMEDGEFLRGARDSRLRAVWDKAGAERFSTLRG